MCGGGQEATRNAKDCGKEFRVALSFAWLPHPAGACNEIYALSLSLSCVELCICFSRVNASQTQCLRVSCLSDALVQTQAQAMAATRARFPQNQQTVICTTQRAIVYGHVHGPLHTIACGYFRRKLSRAMYAMGHHLQLPAEISTCNYMQWPVMYMANHMRCHGPSGGTYQINAPPPTLYMRLNSTHINAPPPTLYMRLNSTQAMCRVHTMRSQSSRRRRCGSAACKHAAARAAVADLRRRRGQ